MTTPQPLPRAPLVALVALAAAASLWALFQWGELLVVRAGGTAFCAVSETVDCAAVWDSPFAKAVHDTTKIPVAGWGLMWGLIAFALALAALADPDRAAKRGLSTSLRLVALAGVASVGGLVVASIVAKHLCLGCLGTYIVVLGWSAIAWSSTKATKFAEPQRGVLVALAALVATYLALLYPGMSTPKSSSDLGKDAISAAGKNAGKPAQPQPSRPAGPGPWNGPLLGDADKDSHLQELISQLPPDGLQAMSNMFEQYERAPVGTLPPTRVVHGDKDAPARFVDWTDPLCPHCAELHEVFDELARVLPPSTFAIEPHHFPLDGLCNSKVQRKNETGEVRCAAVKAQLCLEDDPPKLHLAQKVIFSAQHGLTVDKMWEILKPITDRKKLEACMASPETQKKLDDDIAAAEANKLQGTPLVLLNGKEIAPWGPVLYALALTNGKTKHAAFAKLPPPKAMPHGHGPHDGHQH